MSPDEMADVELAAMAHSAIGQQRKEQNMLSKARNPFSELIEVEHDDHHEAGAQQTGEDSSPALEVDTSSYEPSSSSVFESHVSNTASNLETSDQADATALLTGVPSNSEESRALARQQSIEAAAEQREQEMEGLQKSHSSAQDTNSNPAGEVAVEQHFEDSSLKGALESIETEQTLQRAEYREAP